MKTRQTKKQALAELCQAHFKLGLDRPATATSYASLLPYQLCCPTSFATLLC